MGVALAIALGWGLAEATLFFIVPDVLLTFLAISHPKRALYACIAALAGALIGGAMMYYLGAYHHVTALQWLNTIPAISPELIGEVRQSIETNGIATALLAGGFQGVPYKIFAVIAGQTEIGMGYFLLSSIIPRLSRFLLVTIVAIGVASLLRRCLSPKAIYAIHICLWVIFYIGYFMVM